MSGGLATLALRSLRNRAPTALLTLLTLGVAVALLLGVERLRTETREAFLRSVNGTDLIIGARAHPVQLLLYAVFRIGDATNNLSWESYQRLAAHRAVDWVVPIALGDSHRGFRVVGTTADYFQRIGASAPARFASGAVFDGVFDAVVGAEVARSLGYRVGDSLVLAHGTSRVSLQQHDDRPFTVSGVLAPTGTPLDQAVYVSLPAIEAIHLNWRSGTRAGKAPALDEATLRALHPASVTALFVGTHQRSGVFALQREVAGMREEPLTAVLPGVALQQLWRLLGGVESALRLASAAVVGCGLMVLLSGLLATLNERRREMAVLRAVGAGARHVFGLLLLEAAWLVTGALALGTALAHIGFALAAPWLQAELGVRIGAGWPRAGEWQLLAALLVAGALVSLLPAAFAYRRSLHDGMAVDR